ncbi:MAG TPA: FtsX-like permease family protein, partial [Patescibacteria group bacterium]|nr:FtsX-like permease family protein [Patescibacteria group bacterium]
GVGIMNIMYVIINERTQEIGLRKAVGAKRRDVLIQFLIESVLITVLGGIIGIIIGIAASYAITQGATAYGLSWDFSIPAQAYWTALIFSVVCGILFGLYPAKKASDLDPLVALRRE